MIKNIAIIAVVLSSGAALMAVGIRHTIKAMYSYLNADPDSLETARSVLLITTSLSVLFIMFFILCFCIFALIVFFVKMRKRQESCN